jgi:hypothetical protein
LWLHEACVALILPHDKAMVSNTRSCRNAGFWYGLFLFSLGFSAAASLEL